MGARRGRGRGGRKGAAANVNPQPLQVEIQRELLVDNQARGIEHNLSIINFRPSNIKFSLVIVKPLILIAVLNLKWYADQYFKAYQTCSGSAKKIEEPGPSSVIKSMGPQDLDYDVAVYSIVHGISALETAKWRDLFGKLYTQKADMDEGVYGAFDRMRNLYMEVKPCDAKGYPNKILQYFKKLFHVHKVKNVSYVLLFHLLGESNI